MKHIVKELKECLGLLKKTAAMAEKGLDDLSLTGRIKVCGTKKYPQFYLIEKSGSRNGKYLGKKNLPVIKAYFQRDYNRRQKKKCIFLIKIIERFLNNLPPELTGPWETSDLSSSGAVQCESLKNFLVKESPVRRPYINTHLLTDDEYAAQWQAIPYKGKSFGNDAPELFTDRGERVRSKSEMLIANRLSALGICYRYEYPIKLKDRFGQKLTVYPDFTILDKCSRAEILLEHFGKMDDPDYVASFIEKLSLYGRNGIFPGSGLMFTTETSRRPLDIRLFEKYLRTFLNQCL